MKVHLFGATSSPSCAAFCLCTVAKDFGAEFEPVVASTVERSFYVDDLLASVSDAENAKILINGLGSICLKLGSTKRNGHLIVLMFCSICHRMNCPIHVGRTVSVIGVQWNVCEDQFCFLVKPPMKPCMCRGLLSTANFLFDPLGFVAPVVLKARCIHHSLCQQEIEWNEPMPERELRKWEMWLASLSQLQHVAIPRCLGLSSCGDMQRCQFHYFADVSITAYGVVCFLHSVDNKNNIVCSFIMSKSHLAPLDEVSVSSLELMAAVLAIKLEMMVKYSGPILRSFF